MTFKDICGATKPMLLAALVLCLSPAARVRASGLPALGPKIGPGGAKSLRYVVKSKYYTVKSGKEPFAVLSDPLPLNLFIEDLSKRIGWQRVVPPEIDQPQCTDEEPCEQVWFREEPDPANYGMRQMMVWLQRDPVAEGNRCVYVIGKERPLREPVVTTGEEDAQRRLLQGAALQLWNYDKRRATTESPVLSAAR